MPHLIRVILEKSLSNGLDDINHTDFHSIKSKTENFFFFRLQNSVFFFFYLFCLSLGTRTCILFLVHMHLFESSAIFSFIMNENIINIIITECSEYACLQ